MKFTIWTFYWNIDLNLCNLYLYFLHLYLWNLYLYLWNLYLCLSVFFDSCICIIYLNLFEMYLCLKSVFVFAQPVSLPSCGWHDLYCLAVRLPAQYSEAPSWAQRSKDKWDRSTFPTMRSGYTHLTHLLKRKKTGKLKTLRNEIVNISNNVMSHTHVKKNG